MGVNIDGKLTFSPSYASWLEKHSGRFNDYLNTCIDIDSRDYAKKILSSNPWIGKVVLSDFIQNSEDLNHNLHRVIEYEISAGHEVSVISGSKRSGKTATSVSVIEKAQEEHGEINKVYVGAPNRELEAHGWETISDIEGLKENDMGTHDEAAVFLGSRRGMSNYNVEFLENLPTISHKNLKNISILSQSTKRMDVGILDYASTHIIKTYSDAFSLNVERGIISDDLIYEFLLPRKGYIKPDSSIKDWSFVRTGEFMCLMYCPMVSWYSDKVGKAFNLFDNEKQGFEWATAMLLHDDYDVVYMQKYMKIRGIDRNKIFWEEFKDKVMFEAYPVSDKVKEEVKEVVKEGLIEEGSQEMENYEMLLKRKEAKKKKIGRG